MKRIPLVLAAPALAPRPPRHRQLHLRPHRLRSLVIVDLSDGLRQGKNIASANGSPTPRRGDIPRRCCEFRFALETVHGVATSVEFVTVGICNWFIVSTPTNEGSYCLDDSPVMEAA